jgi:hypothetical protein
MKTTLQELVDEMKDYSYKVSKEGNLDMVAAFHYAIGLAKKSIEKEKEQIIDAYENGVGHENERNLSGQFTNAEEYYNQTYNQNK